MIAAVELQAALFEALSGDAELTALIGADRVHDDVPEGARPPYVRFGRNSFTDWNTATETGQEHRFELEAWSAQDGRKDAARIADRLRIVALGLTISAPAIRLVNLEHLSTTIERDPATDWFRAFVSLRAVTEIA